VTSGNASAAPVVPVAMINKAIMARVLSHLRQDAAMRRSAAAFGGRMDDGGASHIEEVCNAYESGMAGQIPAAWMSTYRSMEIEAARSSDPEFAEYQRLTAKFGDKS
jgi:hypothetical protein